MTQEHYVSRKHSVLLPLWIGYDWGLATYLYQLLFLDNLLIILLVRCECVIWRTAFLLSIWRHSNTSPAPMIPPYNGKKGRAVSISYFGHNAFLLHRKQYHIGGIKWKNTKHVSMIKFLRRDWSTRRLGLATKVRRKSSFCEHCDLNMTYACNLSLKKLTGKVPTPFKILDD